MFKSTENYSYFLKRFNFYLSDVIEVYAYCLLDNHFHFLIRIIDNLEPFIVSKKMAIKLSPHEMISKQFRLFFQSYAMSFNNQYDRVGTLFQTPFKRVLVNDGNYLTHLIFYTHANRQKHKLIDNFVNWKWSSYNGLKGDADTKLFRKEVIELFGGKLPFIDFHQSNIELLNEKCIIE